MSLDVLYVRSLFRPADLGGNRYPWEVTRRLAQRGHAVRVITPRPSGPLPGPTQAKIHPYPVLRRTPLATFATNALLSHLAVEREIGRRRPSLIVLSSYEVAYGNFVMPGRARRIPSVYIYHGRFVSDAVDRTSAGDGPLRVVAGLLRRFVRHAEHVALSSPAAVVAVSPFSRDEIAQRVGRTHDVDVIPTGIDVDLFRPGPRDEARQRLGLRPDDKVLLAVGRLSPVKRYDRAIDTLAILRREDPRYRLVIAGDGPERARLEEHARGRGVEEAVRFDGFTDGAALLERVWAADLELCTSEFENWSLAILEAFAAGIPVVGVPRGGVPEIVGLIDARLLADGVEPAQIASTVARWMDAPALRAEVSMRASMIVRERFGWESVVDRLEQLLGRVAA